MLGLGCRSPGQMNSYIESHNAENRLLEDEIYALQGENEALQAEVASLQEKLQRAKPGAAHSTAPGGGLFRRNRSSEPGGTDPGHLPSLPEIEEGDSVAPEEVMPQGAGIAPDKRPTWSPTPPTRAELPSKSLPSHSVQMPVDDKHEDKSLPVTPKPAPAEDLQLPAESELPAPEGPAETPKTQAEPEPIDNKVSQLFLHPQFTGSANLDSSPGDDGIRVLIQPQNKSGEFLPQAGHITIVALDPSRQGDAARLARWEFEADAIAPMLSANGARRGIYLQLPWPGQPPAGKQLQLFVRYRQGNETPVQTRQEIAMLDSPKLPERWVRRQPRSNSESSMARSPYMQDSGVRAASAEEPVNARR